jgi:hypothetical protein
MNNIILYPKIGTKALEIIENSINSTDIITDEIVKPRQQLIDIILTEFKHSPSLKHVSNNFYVAVALALNDTKSEYENSDFVKDHTDYHIEYTTIHRPGKKQSFYFILRCPSYNYQLFLDQAHNLDSTIGFESCHYLYGNLNKEYMFIFEIDSQTEVALRLRDSSSSIFFEHSRRVFQSKLTDSTPLIFPIVYK